MPWPTPMHIVAIARLPPRVSSAFTAVSASRAPDMPSGWPERDRAAVRVHMLGVIRQPELARHREALRGERLVQFDHVDVADLHAETLEQLLRRRRRADAHDARRHAGGRHRHHARPRRQAMPLRRLPPRR